MEDARMRQGELQMRCYLSLSPKVSFSGDMEKCPDWSSTDAIITVDEAEIIEGKTVVSDNGGEGSEVERSSDFS